jgi:hypothetical protein
VIYRWCGEWPCVRKYVAVGLVVTGIDAKFLIGIDAKFLIDVDAFNVDCDDCLLVEKTCPMSFIF